jgi:molybdate transport system substrate-binding protein
MQKSSLLRLLLIGALTFALAGFASACGSSAPSESAAEEPAASETPAEPVTLQIFAANSLEKALPEVQALYTAAHPEVSFAESQLKASGDLVEQLAAGATADVLITASAGTMDTASENGSVDGATRVDMFGNDLVVVRAAGSDIQIASLEDVTSAAISRIAIGDAATVPAGTYANQALQSVGLYSSETGKDGEYDPALDSKVVLADKVGTAANYVATGDCQIGFVYSSDVYRYPDIEIAYVTPASSHKAIVYPGAVVSGSANANVAADFLNFCLTDPDAQAVWSKYGFQVL